MIFIPPYNEKELLRQVAAGDEQAFGELFNAYRKKLYTNIYKLTNSGEVAEDTVHDVFLKVWINRQSLPEIDNFSAYLSRMAHNHAVTGFRRMAKEALILAELKKKEQWHEVEPPSGALMAKEVQQFIQNAVDRLTPRQREIFILSRESGLKHREIAEKLKISVMAVKKHMGDALHILREEIGNLYGPYAVALYVICDVASA
ncbi:MAG: RNA polymerase sigma-70 factor [Chitinophagaceae bacterium]|nr:RNA polymerase sigma-70 factor [Chitinophagaceae bacterium]